MWKESLVVINLQTIITRLTLQLFLTHCFGSVSLLSSALFPDTAVFSKKAVRYLHDVHSSGGRRHDSKCQCCFKSAELINSISQSTLTYNMMITQLVSVTQCKFKWQLNNGDHPCTILEKNKSDRNILLCEETQTTNASTFTVWCLLKSSGGSVCVHVKGHKSGCHKSVSILRLLSTYAVGIYMWSMSIWMWK